MERVRHLGSVSSVINRAWERIHQSLSFAGSPDGFIHTNCVARPDTKKAF